MKINDCVYENTSILLSAEQNDRLETYYETLSMWNRKFNLTAITQKEDVYVKHFADSMLGSFALKENACVCDIGSGGGFPSAPLGILRPDLKFVMLDSVNKKVVFLKEIIQKLNLNAEAVCCRAEDYPTRGIFDAVVARAVAPVSTLLEYSAPLLKTGGIAVLYKTSNEDLSASVNAQRLLSMELSQKKEFVLPNGDGRIIYVFVKTAPTDKKYPRGGNKPRLQPL